MSAWGVEPVVLHRYLRDLVAEYRAIPTFCALRSPATSPSSSMPRTAASSIAVVARYARVDLLILDELAYVSLAAGGAELLFRVLGERQERRPIIVTANLTFGEWTKMFPGPRLCRAIVDRLTHRAHIIDTGEDSERLKETMRRIAARRSADGVPVPAST